jgi:hypothetical protein
MVGKGKGFMMHCSQVVTCTDNNKYIDTFTVFYCHFVEVPQFSVYSQVIWLGLRTLKLMFRWCDLGSYYSRTLLSFKVVSSEQQA